MPGQRELDDSTAYTVIGCDYRKRRSTSLLGAERLRTDGCCHNFRQSLCPLLSPIQGDTVEAKFRADWGSPAIPQAIHQDGVIGRLLRVNRKPETSPKPQGVFPRPGEATARGTASDISTSSARADVRSSHATRFPIRCHAYNALVAPNDLPRCRETRRAFRRKHRPRQVKMFNRDRATTKGLRNLTFPYTGLRPAAISNRECKSTHRYCHGGCDRREPSPR